ELSKTLSLLSTFLVISGFVLGTLGVGVSLFFFSMALALAIASTVGTPVKVIFDGEVLSVNLNDEQPFVVIQHGKYFTTYTNLNGINVSKGQSVKRGQVIGRVATNYDGDGSMDFYMSTETGFVDPERWLRRK
ncbi:MAG: M23 family metallopeptidase, partial [Ferruginibacter sp.]